MHFGICNCQKMQVLYANFTLIKSKLGDKNVRSNKGKESNVSNVLLAVVVCLGHALYLTVHLATTGACTIHLVVAAIRGVGPTQLSLMSFFRLRYFYPAIQNQWTLWWKKARDHHRLTMSELSGAHQHALLLGLFV